MIDSLYMKVIHDINKHHYTIDEICSKFYCDSFKSLLSYLTTTFQYSFDDNYDADYIKDYHDFLYNLTDSCNDLEHLQFLSFTIDKHIRFIKELLKPYNKKEKEKDSLYHYLKRLKSELVGNQAYNDNKLFSLYENDNIKVIKYIIFDLKDLNALYQIISTHKKVVNIQNTDDEPLIEIIIRYIINNVKELEDKDIEYYKRVLTMLFLRDELDIEDAKLDQLISEISFITNKKCEPIFEYISKLLNDYNNKRYKDKVASTIIDNPITDERIDLRYLPTISIDYIKYIDGTKVLFDDAFSFEELKDGTIYFYLHVPDIDKFISYSSELDNYMKEMGLSRYAKCDKRPMIPFDIANKMSLKQDNDRCAITYRFHVKRDGTLINLDVMESIINVNTNLAKSKADILINDPNYEFKELLDHMYRFCKRLRINRHERIGKRSKAGIIMDEFNIWSNIYVASYCMENNILFPYKNFTGEEETGKYLLAISSFLRENKIDKNARIILDSLMKTKPRVYYQEQPIGNHNFNNLPYGNIGNPLREYISLETGRLLKDAFINDNLSEWEQRINDDCILATEQEAKVKELYKTS